MASRTAELKVKVTSDSSSAAKNVDSVGSKVAGFAKKALKAGAAVAIALGAATLWKGFQRLQAIDQAEAKLRGLGYSAKQVDKIMSNATTAVKGTAFGLGEAATAAAGAVAAGVKPGKDLTRTLTLIGDAATIAGTDFASMGAIFNKVAASNKIQGDTIAQLQDQGIPIVKMLGKELGKTSAQVIKLASEGKINFKQFQNAMEAGLGGAAQESGKTFTGALANVWAALGRLGAGLLQGVFAKMPALFGRITGYIDMLGPAATQAGNAIGSAFGKLPGLFAQLAATPQIQALGRAIMNFGKSLAAAGRTAAPALATIWAALQPILRVAAGAAILGLTAAFTALGVGVRKAASMFAASVKWIDQNRDTAAALAAIITTLLLPALIAWGVNATIAGAKNVAAWTLARAASIKSAAAQVKSLTMTTLGWVKQGAIAIAQAAKVVAGWVLMGVQSTANAIKIAAAWLVANGPGLAAAMSIFASAVAAMVAGWVRMGIQATINAAKIAVAWFVALGPVGWIIAGLIAVGAAFVVLWTKCKTFRVIVTAVFNAVKGAAMTAFNWIRSNWRLLAAILLGPFGIAIGLITKYWSQIKSGAASVFNWIKANWPLLVGIILGPFGIAAALIIKHWSQVKKALSQGWGKITGAAKGAANKVRAAFTRVWNVLKAAVRAYGQVARTVFNAIRSVAASVANRVKSVFKGAWDVVKTSVRAMSQVVRSVFQAIRDTAANITGRIKDLFRSAWDVIKSGARAVKAVVNPIFSAIRSAVSSVVSKVGDLAGKLRSISVPGTLVSAFNAVKSAVDKVVSAVNSLINALRNIPTPKINWPSPPSWFNKLNPLKAVNPMVTRPVAPVVPMTRGLGAPAVATTPAAAAAGIHITVNGAVDPEGVARQIQRILSNHERRIGLRTA